MKFNFQVVKALIKPNQFTRPQRKLSPGKIFHIVHYTANTNADAMDNRNFFNNRTGSYGSTQWILDKDVAVLCIPEDEVSYNAGYYTVPSSTAPKWRTDVYKVFIEKYTNGENINNRSIAYELCNNDAMHGGDWNKTVDNGAQLVAFNCIRTNSNPNTDVHRHWDVCRKECPLPLKDDKVWEAFLDKVKKYYNEYKAKGITSKDEIEFSQPIRVLKKGMQGDDVKELQVNLNKIGFKLVADGDFGQLTHDAVVVFQESKRLVKDGIFGNSSRMELEKALEVIVPRPTPENPITKPPIIQLPFLDVEDKGNEMLNAIQWTKDIGLFKGDGNGNFMPDRPLTRAELALILYREHKIKNNITVDPIKFK
jgi:N-acetylmuramoyl-L-alanine amidase CwlA